MQVQYEILAIVLTGILAFAGGMKKAKSTCCCCAFEIDRDTDTNKLQGVKVVRGGSMRASTPPPLPPQPAVSLWTRMFTDLNALSSEGAAADVQEAERGRERPRSLKIRR